MTADEYLYILRRQLADFSPGEQAAILAEIGSHIESFEDDQSTQEDAVQWRDRCMAELGSPQELSGKLKMLYRPDRWVDTLFVLLPFLLYPLANVALQKLFGFEYVAQVEIVMYSLLIFIGLRRRSMAVSIFWTASIITQVASMLLAGRTLFGALQFAVWLAYATGLLFLLAWLVWKNRGDLLMVGLACLPLALCAYGSLFAALQSPGNSSLLGAFDRFLLHFYLLTGSGNGGYFQYFGYVVAITLFFLFTKRNVRWLGLAIFGMVDALSRTYLNMYAGLLAPWVYSVYAFIPPAIVFLGWNLERQARDRAKSTLQVAQN